MEGSTAPTAISAQISDRGSNAVAIDASPPTLQKADVRKVRAPVHPVAFLFYFLVLAVLAVVVYLVYITPALATTALFISLLMSFVLSCTLLSVATHCRMLSLTLSYQHVDAARRTGADPHIEQIERNRVRSAHWARKVYAFLGRLGLAIALGLSCALVLIEEKTSTTTTTAVSMGVFALFACLCNIPTFNTRFRSSDDYARRMFRFHFRHVNDVNHQNITALLEAGTIRLLSCSWLINLSEGSKLQRCQELPRDAFVSESRAVNLFETKKVYVLSYGWLSRGNPDPFGSRLVTLQNFLRTSASHEWALFWDFGSLPQHQRTPEEDQQFKAALSVMSILYGSSLTTVLILKDIPTPSDQVFDFGYNDTPYDGRGRCIMESAVAGFAAYYLNMPELVLEISSQHVPRTPQLGKPDLEAVQDRLESAAFTCGKDDLDKVMKQLKDFNALYVGLNSC